MVEDPVIASLQAAVAAAPDDVPLRLLLARKLLDASAVDRAMAEIGAAVQRDPSSAEAQQLMREALGQPAPEPAAPVPSTWITAGRRPRTRYARSSHPGSSRTPRNKKLPPDDELADYLRSRSML
ncbi:MAG TPA: tetratricopeptide repeat protein [Pseudonocardiaceae bacterium]|jgi:hypothetical protein